MKQAILVRQDLKLPKGKLAVQVAHASIEATLKSDPKKIDTWRKQGMKKIVLKVKDLKELKSFLKRAKNLKITTSIIKDAGLTTIRPGTITCLAIGPDSDNKIDFIIKELKLI